MSKKIEIKSGNNKNVLELSTHTTLDNRICKHLSTLSNNGYNVLYINSFDDHERLTIKNVQHHNLGVAFNKRNIIGVISAFLRMRRYITTNKVKYDILHIHDAILLPIAHVAKRKKMKVVYDRHESYNLIGGVIGKLSSFFEIKEKPYIDGVVYVANVQEEYLKKTGFKKLMHIPNYQSIDIYNSIQKTASSGKSIKMVYFGYLTDSSRNITGMLNVIERIIQKNSSVTVEIGGKIDGEKLNNHIERMEGEYTTFKYLGIMKYSEVVQRTINADVGLYFQRASKNNFGSSPNKIYEYLIAGLAICAQGRFSDWEKINDHVGVVLPYEANEDELYIALEHMISDREQLQRYKANAKELSRNYTWESIERRYIELYESL